MVTKRTINERIANRGIVLVGGYKGARKKCIFRCGEGHEWIAVTDAVSRGNGCPHCAGNAPLSKSIINERIAHRGIMVVGEYKNTDTKTTFWCGSGHEWSARPAHVMNGTGCPICAVRGPKKRGASHSLQDGASELTSITPG